MFDKLVKRSAFLVCALAVAGWASGSPQPQPHVELNVQLRGVRVGHPLPAYTHDEVVVLDDQKVTAEVSVSYAVTDPRVAHSGRSIDFPRAWSSLVRWEIRNEKGDVFPGVTITSTPSGTGGARSLVDDGTILRAGVTIGPLSSGGHYQIHASLPVEQNGETTTVNAPVTFVYVARGDESGDIRARLLMDEAERLARNPNFSFEEYRALMEKLRTIPHYQFEATNQLAAKSIGRVPASESLGYVREARAALEEWKKGANIERVPPGIIDLWKTAAAAYESFERVYPVYTKRESELSISLEGRGETTRYVLRDKRDGRIVPAP